MVLLVLSCSSGNGDYPEAVNGVLDLSDRDWEMQGPADLGGEWKYKKDGESGWQIIKMPAFWHGLFQDPKGCYYFQLDVKLGDSDNLAIFLENAYTSYDLYINGEKILSNGVTGKNAQTNIPQQLPACRLIQKSGEISIVLKIANYHDVFGGLEEVPRIGLFRALEQEKYNRIFFHFFVIGILILSGLHHFFIWAGRRKEKANLLFCLCCLAIAAYLVSFNGYIAQLFPDSMSFVFHLTMKLNFISILCFCLIIPLFFSLFYPNEFSRKILLGFRWLTVALILFVVFTKTRIFTALIFPFVILHFLLFTWIFVSLLKAAVKRRKSSLLFLTGYVIIILTITNDILNECALINTSSIVPVGVTLAIILYSFALSDFFIHAFKNSKYLEKHLQFEVDKQTSLLNRRNMELDSALKELKDSEKQKTVFFQNISHELRTPLTLILDPVDTIRKKYIDKIPNKAVRLIDNMEKNAEELEQLSEQLVDLSRASIEKEFTESTEADSDTSSLWEKKINLRKILIVDDNQDFRKYLSENLDTGYSVYEADNGPEALNILKGNAIDLIICELKMQQMDGFHLKRKINENRDTCGIPFIVLSDNNADRERINALSIGAVDYITKPFNIEILAGKIVSLLNWLTIQKMHHKSLLEKKLIDEIKQDKEQDEEMQYFNSQCKRYEVSEREKEIISNIMAAKMNKSISEDLSISISTVKNHIRSIFLKCNVKNRVELMNIFRGV